MTEPLRHPHRSLFDEELQRVRDVIIAMGEHVDVAITRAIGGLVDRDVEACSAVIADDQRLNLMQSEVRELCFTIILTQAPVARDLREIMGYMHMATELERMGDHCVSIAKIARNLADLPALKRYVDIPKMAEYCAQQVRDMLHAVVDRDVEEAKRVAERDDRVDRVYHRLFDDLIQMMIDDSDTVYRATNLVFIAHHLERIADRVTNLAEDLVFLETGEIQELG